MRTKLAVPLLASILILGLIGFTQEADAATRTFTSDNLNYLNPKPISKTGHLTKSATFFIRHDQP